MKWNNASSSGTANAEVSHKPSDVPRIIKRSPHAILALFVLMINGSWAVYYYQFENLPTPLTADEAGKTGFSEEEAMNYVKDLTDFGPRPVGSDAVDLALPDVLAVSENIKKTAHWEVDVQVDFFHAHSGANRLVGGLFKGRTLVYSDLNHIVLTISPKHASDEEESAILISSHIDTKFSTEGAGDCSSSVAVKVNYWPQKHRNAAIERLLTWQCMKDFSSMIRTHAF